MPAGSVERLLANCQSYARCACGKRMRPEASACWRCSLKQRRPAYPDRFKLCPSCGTNKTLRDRPMCHPCELKAHMAYHREPCPTCDGTRYSNRPRCWRCEEKLQAASRNVTNPRYATCVNCGERCLAGRDRCSECRATAQAQVTVAWQLVPCPTCPRLWRSNRPQCARCLAKLNYVPAPRSVPCPRCAKHQTRPGSTECRSCRLCDQAEQARAERPALYDLCPVCSKRNKRVDAVQCWRCNYNDQRSRTLAEPKPLVVRDQAAINAKRYELCPRCTSRLMMRGAAQCGSCTKNDAERADRHTCPGCGGECSRNSALCRPCSSASRRKPVTDNARRNERRAVAKAARHRLTRRVLIVSLARLAGVMRAMPVPGLVSAPTPVAEPKPPVAIDLPTAPSVQPALKLHLVTAGQKKGNHASNRTRTSQTAFVTGLFKPAGYCPRCDPCDSQSGNQSGNHKECRHQLPPKIENGICYRCATGRPVSDEIRAVRERVWARTRKRDAA